MAGQDDMDQKEKTRRKILQVARRIFARSGFEGASVDAIVRTSGLSKGALYWHFPGKLELYREIMHEEMRVIMEHFRIPEAMKGNIDPVSFLIGKGRSLIDDLQANPERHMLWVDLTVVAQRGDPSARALAGEIIDTLIDSILPELDAFFPMDAAEDGFKCSKDRLLCLTHTFAGFVVNLGLRLKPDDAKRYWETIVRMLLDRGNPREVS